MYHNTQLAILKLINTSNKLAFKKTYNQYEF
jgi:hypothetical protein